MDVVLTKVLPAKCRAIALARTWLFSEALPPTALDAAMLFAAQVHLRCEVTLRVPPLLPLPLPGYLA